MEGFLSRGWELILPGCGGTSALARGQLSLRAGSMSSSPSAIIQWGWGFRTLRGGIDPGELPRRPRVVGVVEIWKGSEPGMGTHLPRGRRELGVGPSGKLSPRNGSMSPSQSAITQWGWGFHIQRGGIDQGNLRFCTHVVRVVSICKNFHSGDEILSSPGVAGPRRCPERQLSPRAESMSPSQSAITQLG